MHKEIKQLKPGDVIITFLKNNQNTLYKKEFTAQKIYENYILSTNNIKLHSDYSVNNNHYYKIKQI